MAPRKPRPYNMRSPVSRAAGTRWRYKAASGRTLRPIVDFTKGLQTVASRPFRLESQDLLVGLPMACGCNTHQPLPAIDDQAGRGGGFYRSWKRETSFVKYISQTSNKKPPRLLESSRKGKVNFGPMRSFTETGERERVHEPCLLHL